MTSTMPKSMDDLNGLLEERTRYERWIAQLQAKREQTPGHVYERVRADYMSRLEGVMTQLRSKGEGLQVTATTLEQQVAAIGSEEAQRRDVRAEIELRALVGEYTPERAHTELAACDAEISRLESERKSAAGELTRLQEILTAIRQPAPGQAAPAPAAAAPPAPAAAPPAPAPKSRPLGAPTPVQNDTHEELAFLNSVVERHEPAASASPAPAAAPSPPAAAPVRLSDDIPVVTSLEPAVRSEPQEQPPQTLRQTAGTPSFLKGLPTEQVKTLKCQECGTMNYPTEWYCERCGGELAAM
jgi:hypothetical protein